MLGIEFAVGRDFIPSKIAPENKGDTHRSLTHKRIARAFPTKIFVLRDYALMVLTRLAQAWKPDVSSRADNTFAPVEPVN